MEATLRNQTTLGNVLERFLSESKTGIATLKELYEAAKEWPSPSVRRTVYTDSKERFARVAKGVYMLKGEHSASLLIHGDGRKLAEIEDNSISAIITDHPWDSKSNRGGNRHYSLYNTFCYTQEDFDAKARVLIPGGYLAEFLPVKSAENRKYLNQIDEMAERAGLQFYCNIIWRKQKEGTVNTGRCTKGVEQIAIYTKGKPRSLNAGGLAYQTTNILNFELDFPIHRIAKQRNHQAEKPIDLYEYLIKQLTQEDEVCLDQFGGSCNMISAAIHLKRFSIVYEWARDAVKKAVSRFGCHILCEAVEESTEPAAEFNSDKVVSMEKVPDGTKMMVDTAPQVTRLQSATEEKVPDGTKMVVAIDLAVTQFQLEFLKTVRAKKTSLLTTDEIAFVASLKTDIDQNSNTYSINDLFADVAMRGYHSYSLPEYECNLMEISSIETIIEETDILFAKKFPETLLWPYYQNFRMEIRSYVSFCVLNKKAYGSNNPLAALPEYLAWMQTNGVGNFQRSERLLHEFFAISTDECKELP